MKPLAIVGIVLILLGVVSLVYQGIPYTTRETVIDIGSVHATTEKHHLIPVPPVVGLASVAAGVALVVAGSRTRV